MGAAFCWNSQAQKGKTRGKAEGPLPTGFILGVQDLRGFKIPAGKIEFRDRCPDHAGTIVRGSFMLRIGHGSTQKSSFQIIHRDQENNIRIGYPLPHYYKGKAPFYYRHLRLCPSASLPTISIEGGSCNLPPTGTNGKGGTGGLFGKPPLPPSPICSYSGKAAYSSQLGHRILRAESLLFKGGRSNNREQGQQTRISA